MISKNKLDVFTKSGRSSDIISAHHLQICLITIVSPSTTMFTYHSPILFFASYRRRGKTQDANQYLANIYSLYPPPPPPAREAAVPETSITGGIPQVHDTRPPSISVTEAEAQKSKPVKKRRHFNFVPLKKTITLSPRAVEVLRDLSNQPEAKLIKISVANRGCSGSAYDLKYVEKGALSDIVHEQDGVKVLIDPTAQLKIIGSTMDWVEDRLSAKFVFDNPNIDKSCGCGESFMTKDESAAREAEKKASKGL
ncbi:iron-sulfur cluster assembly accessory protein [Botrytis cinerea]